MTAPLYRRPAHFILLFIITMSALNFFARLGLGTPALPASAPISPPAASAPPVPGTVPPAAPPAQTPPAAPRAAAPPAGGPLDPAALMVERNNLIAALEAAQASNAAAAEQLASANAAVTTLTGQLSAVNATVTTLTTERDTARASANLTVEQVRNQELAALAASQGIPPGAVPPVDPAAPAAAGGSAFWDKHVSLKDHPLAQADHILKTLKINV